MKTSRIVLSALLATSLLSSASYAADSATGSASATVVAALSVSEQSPMSFGQFSAGSGGTTATDGTTTGSVTYVGGSISPGVFAVTGTPSAGYDVTVDPTVTLNRTGGGGSMTASLNTPGSTLLDVNGNDTFDIHGTLTVGNNQAGGNYTGTYNVSVAY